MEEAPSKKAKKTYINGYRCSNIRCPDPMYLFDCQQCGKETNVHDSCPNCHRLLSSEKKLPPRGPRIMGHRSLYRCTNTTCPDPMYSFDCPHCGKFTVWTHCPYCGLIAQDPPPQDPGGPKPDAAPMPKAEEDDSDNCPECMAQEDDSDNPCPHHRWVFEPQRGRRQTTCSDAKSFNSHNHTDYIQCTEIIKY